jgi:hypothetical protein
MLLSVRPARPPESERLPDGKNQFFRTKYGGRIATTRPTGVELLMRSAIVRSSGI